MRIGVVLAGAWMVGSVGGFAATDAPTQQVDWKSMLPMVRIAVRHEFPKSVAQAHYPPTILRTADFTVKHPLETKSAANVQPGGTAK